MSDSAWSIEGLLQHEPFVRAVVRGILADEGGVQDVLQETWMRVLRRRPSASPPRSWLARVAANLALDSCRGALRRERRERELARPEASEAADAALERLSAQRALVDAVLELAEPYRSVVLLRYFEALEPAEIARRLGRSAATVRSQLSRAHAILRRALDAELDGGRSAWSLLILPAASGSTTSLVPTGASAAKVAALALGVGAVGIFVLFRLARPGLPPADVVRLTPVTLAPQPTPSPSVATGLASPAGAVADPARRAVEPQAVADQSHSRPDLGSLTTQELFELGVQTQRAIKASLLTPDERLVQENASFLSRADTGIVRLLERVNNESEFDHAMGVRGGGTYFSFATGDHSYESEPDLCYINAWRREQVDPPPEITADVERTVSRSLPITAFTTPFFGTQLGLLIELGDVGLDKIPRRASPIPAWVPPDRAEAWNVLWSELTLEDAQYGSEFRARAKKLFGTNLYVEWRGAPTTFLLRTFSPGEHDHLIAFRAVERGERSCTLLWRLLATWPVPGKKRDPSPLLTEHREVRKGPAWLAKMDLPDLLDLLAAIQEQARPRLFDVPAALIEPCRLAFGEDSFGERAGVSRILYRYRWDSLVDYWGGGAYFSFLTRSNSYDESPDLELAYYGYDKPPDFEKRESYYSSGFAGGDLGYLYDFGEVPARELESIVAGQRPASFSEPEERAWDFLWTVNAQPGNNGRRIVAPEDVARAAELGVEDDIPAIVGHTYLLRTVLFDSHDHLVVFKTVNGDETGHTLAWRILRSWSVEGR